MRIWSYRAVFILGHMRTVSANDSGRYVCKAFTHWMTPSIRDVLERVARNSPIALLSPEETIWTREW